MINSRNPWPSIIGGMLVVAVIGVALSAAALVPVVIGAVLALARLQARAVDVMLAMVNGMTGVEYCGDSEGLRLLAGGIFGAALFALIYVAVLIGTHVMVLIMVTMGGGIISVVLTIVARMNSDEPSDFLGRLRFWDEDQ